ncbi:hypothetical protein ABIB73_007507 [Bradyrhizobium sp. F1.4.3]|uniref:SEC-C domain-containing protein n=1 Tax=Bradyrhizobium sp. F1.4.3 TaxID=3156356 RepID=UPI0033969E33
MVEDIFAQLAAIRQSLEAELKNEANTATSDAKGGGRPQASEPNDVEAEDGPTKRNAPCPCGSGKRFKHCHGQHRGAPPVETPPPPREIAFTTALEISRVPTGNDKPLAADIGPLPQGSPPNVSDRRDAEKRELLDLQGQPSLGGDATGLSTERELSSPEEAEPRQQPEVAPSERRVSKAMEMIVAGHVKVKNRRALVDLLAHRHKVLDELRAVSDINPANVVRTVLDEIALIEVGLEELNPPPGTLPENEWR